MIARAAHTLRELSRRPLAAADALLNALYGWRHNPLYHAGTLVVVAFVVMLVTGLYLLLFYRIGGPWESVARIDAQVWGGRWIRALHRYAADLAVAAAAVHAFRLFVQGRSWGPRTLAWVSGLVLLFLLFVCGWTGYVMLWDDHAQLLAIEGARLMDALPIFAEPISRTFVGERPIPSAFFFLNLFAHIALPIGMALLLWIHVSRLARPVLLPPRPLLWGSVTLLFAASIAIPAPLGPKADLHALLGRVEIDAFYSFWLPLSRALSAPQAWLVLLVGSFVALLAPLWTRPSRAARGEASSVSERLCTGCVQCSLDCPYDAIEMITVGDEPEKQAARVDPRLCVSCGICTASCAPMALGPPGRTGRAELAAVKQFVAEHPPEAGAVILVSCENGSGRLAREESVDGATVYPVSCGGHLHTSVLEYLVRSGAGGVMVAACPPRDCWSREGPKWLEERVLRGREAELRDRVDRRRIRIVHAGEGERRVVRRELAGFREALAELTRAEREAEIDLERVCDPPDEKVAS